MDIIISICHLLKSVKRVFRKLLFGFIIIVFCLVATDVAQAKTISNNFQYIDTARLEYFNNIYLRQDEYSYYLLATDTTTSGYTSYYDYYFCLTNDEIDTSNVLSVSSNCEKMYRYYRNDSTYVMEEYNDDTLEVNNSMYYTSNNYQRNIDIKAWLFVISVGLVCFCLGNVLMCYYRRN